MLKAKIVPVYGPLTCSEDAPLTCAQRRADGCAPVHLCILGQAPGHQGAAAGEEVRGWACCSSCPVYVCQLLDRACCWRARLDLASLCGAQTGAPE